MALLGPDENITGGRAASAEIGLLRSALSSSVKRPQWRAASFRENFQTGHGWTTTGSGVAGSSNLNDTSTFVRGTQSVKLVTTGVAAQANIRKTGLSALDLTGKDFRVVLKVDAPTKVSRINFFVGTSALANNYKWVLNPLSASSRYFLPGEWTTLTFGWSDLNLSAGTYTMNADATPSSKTGFTEMQLQVIDDGTGPVTVQVQSIEIIPAGINAFTKGIVSITFDDSWGDVYDNGRPIMDALGFRGTQYTIAENVGQSGRLTLAQLKSLQDHSGWEVGGHSYSTDVHTTRYPNLTEAEADLDLRRLRAWLLQHGFKGESFAYPGGQFEATTDGVPVDSICARYFSSGRTILSDLGVANIAQETFPPSRYRRLRSIMAISSVSTGQANPTNLVAAGGAIDRAAKSGGWLILTFHRITSGAATDSTQCSVADFQTIMNAVNTSGAAVLPVGEVISNYS